MRARPRDQPVAGADVLRMMKLAGEAPPPSTFYKVLRRVAPRLYLRADGQRNHSRRPAARSCTPTTTSSPSSTRSRQRGEPTVALKGSACLVIACGMRAQALDRDSHPVRLITDTLLQMACSCWTEVPRDRYRSKFRAAPIDRLCTSRMEKS